MVDQITSDPVFIKALQNYHDNDGVSVPKGNQIIGKKIVDILADVFNPDIQTPFKMYFQSKAWPSRVPRQLVNTCISNYAFGDQKIFDLVFRENNTKITRSLLRSIMDRLEDCSPNNARLSWCNALEKLGEYDRDPDEYINPCDVLDKIDLNVYKINLFEI